MRRLALAIVLISTAAAASPGGPPSIVFILTDDLGIADLGAYGSDYHLTPRLDALAAEGMRFTAAYSASPVCSPTRAAPVTPKPHPQRAGSGTPD
jgi:arylsulfatase A-like enzyme